MTVVERRKATKQFVTDWLGRGDEKQETQTFWMTLLSKVYEIYEPDKFIDFERRVEVDDLKTGKRTTKFIDGYIPATRVLIEQKGADIDLRKGYRQSDGSMLTPYQQARRYGGYLPQNEQPRWIVVCNFQEFHIHDMLRPNEAPEIVKLADLEKEYSRLGFLTDTGNENIQREMEISIEAGRLVGRLYDALAKQYGDIGDPAIARSLNVLCVRLVFCLYAEDAGLFPKRLTFHNYLNNYSARDMRRALLDLFEVLNTPREKRSRYLDPELNAFPYVNGGLFAERNVELPMITEEIRTVLLEQASAEFDWSEISPTIFGAVFESTLNPETRRSGGMHYTSIENIHKVIDPLFLDDLKKELAEIRAEPSEKKKIAKLRSFHGCLATMIFLDPACGSGNFLTETYLSLRRLENEIISELYAGQSVLGDIENPIRVSISQFYGIEINDFAVTVAKTALWIAESQMMKATEDIVRLPLDFLPLKTQAGIVEGNALRMDWNDVVPRKKLSYIMGNPPFIGYSLQSREQKEDILSVYVDEKGKPYKTAGKIDYVSGWYWKAAEMMQGTAIRTALVSTNSITQGEQVAFIWKPLYARFNIHIDFAYRTFRWDSEASEKAHVHVVIIGFSVANNKKVKTLYLGDTQRTATQINAYLLDADLVFVEDRKMPLCSGVTVMNKGSQGTDDGAFYFEPDEYEALVKKYPDITAYLRPATNGQIFIKNAKRYCLWVGNMNPSGLRKYPELMERIAKVKRFREASPKEATRRWAEYPYLFTENRQPECGNYLLLPLTSSEKRRYVPLGYLPADVIANNSVQIMPNATLYDFGVLTSNVFMAWMRVVCGRLEMRYRITVTNVYNNFPWPDPTPEQKARIEQTAQAILDARAIYPDSSLADLYDETVMPPELRTAHQKNDRAVWEAYGKVWNIRSESECVAHLMRLYQQLTE